MALKKSILPLITIHEPKYSNTNFDLSDHYPITVKFSDFKLISYNLQLMPAIIGIKGKSSFNEIKAAVAAIAAYLINQDPDICCVQELFDNSANELLAQILLEAGYLASYRLDPSIIPFTNGGIRTFIKKNYAKHDLSIYDYFYHNTIDYFIGADAIAHKGLLHTSFIRGGVRYHIFNTHLQAYYPTREHYTEITLAQCIELKNFIQQQMIKGIISPYDQVILCGDFNIPIVNDEQSSSFLFTKMKKILGPQFNYLKYNLSTSGPQHTFSKRNIYNKNKYGASDLDINTDAVLIFQQQVHGTEQIELELSPLYCDIQHALALYVKNNATIFSWWRLSEAQLKELNSFNNQFALLMNDAEEIKAHNQNPIDNPNWFAKALSLLKGPGDSEDKIDLLANGQMYSKTAPDQNEDITISDNNLNIEQCRQLYERLVFKVKRIYSQVHTDYIYFGEPYRSAFVASFNLNRILAREGGVFFTDPSAQSFYLFKKIILKEINQAQIEFETYPFTWSQVHPIIKGILGVLAILAILPFLCIIASSSEGYKKTFFSPPTPNLTEIKEELATFSNFSHIK